MSVRSLHTMKSIFSRLRWGAFGLACGLAANSALAQASSIYGVTFFDNQLISINPTTGAGTSVATLDQTVAPYGIAFRGNQLYTFDAATDTIRGINKTTGAVSAGINIGVGDLTGEGDLAFRSDGIGFLSSALAPDFSPSNDLFRFDISTGTSTRLGTTDVVLDGLAFWKGTLFAVGQEQDAMLYTVDQTTAALTAIGSLGLANDNLFSGLTFGLDGTLYGSINDRLYTINTMTGAASELDPTVLDTGFASVSGLAFSGGSAVPDTGGFLVEGALGLTVLAAAIRRRRTKRSLQLV